jgi:hypothetical protein
VEEAVKVEVAEQLVGIDSCLRFALFGLECALNVSFAGPECEKVFVDASADHVSAKHYTFFKSSDLTVTGRVDAYEPESIWIRIQSHSGINELLRRVVNGAEVQALRLGNSLQRQGRV